MLGPKDHTTQREYYYQSFTNKQERNNLQDTSDYKSYFQKRGITLTKIMQPVQKEGSKSFYSLDNVLYQTTLNISHQQNLTLVAQLSSLKGDNSTTNG